jgi:hypothetical protein
VPTENPVLVGNVMFRLSVVSTLLADDIGPRLAAGGCVSPLPTAGWVDV